jgi:hypothetical protein
MLHISWNKSGRELTPYFVEIPRQVFNLAAVYFASGANFAAFSPVQRSLTLKDKFQAI